MSKVFLLGANDPEMQEIEKILREHGKKVQYAMSNGKRCHPGNAYKADPVHIDGVIVLIECEPQGIKNFIRIDHHRPGDPGYGLPASEFWQASSLGQLWTLLQLEGLAISPSQDQMILAAMDHCPAAAIRGECPGVSAQDVLERKVQEIAKGTKHELSEVRDRVGYYQVRLMDAPPIQIGQSIISDLRSEYLGEGYDIRLLTAQIAALSDGYTVLLRHRDKEGEPEKWSISGHASPECIQAFKDIWAPSQGLTGIYGVPTRGYAGGYVAEE